MYDRLVAPHQLEGLRSVLLASTCPPIVLRLCSSNILKILAGRRIQVLVPSLHSDIDAIRSTAIKTLGLKGGEWERLGYTIRD